jgi:hypothetical protein
VGIVESFVMLAAVAVVAAAFAYAQRLQHQRTLRIREMMHEERMAAIKQGLELPPHDTPASGGDRPAAGRAALGAGLVFILGGAGMWVAFAFVPTAPDSSEGLHTLRSLGMIPMFIGAGLLFSTWLTRGPSR